MNNDRWPPSVLTALFAAIRLGKPGCVDEKIDKDDWIPGCRIDDLIYDIEDYRLGLRGARDNLLAASGVVLMPFFHRPRRTATSLIGISGLRAADMASFLIYLERLGLNVDPAPLVERLLPSLRAASCLSESEVRVFWYARERHKCETLILRGERLGHQGVREEEFKTGAGYRVRADFIGDEVHCLIVRAPRYRYRHSPEEVTCAVCGLSYLKGDPESSASHRREHKKRLMILEPSPDPKFLEALDVDAEPELVTSASAKWRHAAMYERAATFRREFGYDFVQWNNPRFGKDETGTGFLFNDDSGVFGRGAIVGACSFRWREWKARAPSWGMQWVWIAPKARRRGVLSRRWPIFRERFGEFVIEPPLSEAMAAFAAKVTPAAKETVG